ncbi:MAG: arylsulfatase [Pirellulales bacterium]
MILLAVLLASYPVLAQSRNLPPNVLVILADDQGWGDLSLNGNRNLSTPNVDSLAQAGASFNRFYVCAVCSPTRAEFLTGRYHLRGGVTSTSTGGERLDLDESTIADTFKAAGYATATFGKWHNGMQYPYHPNGRGFEEFYGFCSGHWGNYFSPMLEHNGQIVRGTGYATDDFTNRTMDFIERNRDRPFFAYLAYNTPHSPMQVPDRWWHKFADKELAMRHRDPKRERVPHTRAALAMCENIDWNVGRLLNQLDALKIAENTIVVYFCDNGPNGYRWNGGMKGRKGSTDEGGVRSPLLIRWPKYIEAGKRIDPIAAAIDLLPTLADLAEIEVTSTKPLDGVSLKGNLVDSPQSSTRSNHDQIADNRKIFSHWAGRVSVRTQQYRLDHQGKLYDMQSDPGQHVDISQQQPKQAAQLQQSVERWKKELFPQRDREKRPFIIGHPDCRMTQLPARDGIGLGDIQRSCRHPNCSYFTNWTSLEDRITWNVEVGVGGEYEVELYYTCPQVDAGSTFELSFQGSRLRGQIQEGHNPPLQGQQYDRVPRAESYVKDFKPLKLGTVQLPQGKGELSLRALDIPGTQVMDFRLLMFTRISDSN